ncbi:MAG TPA: hypothetical protein VGM98_21385, partial [Schlesneria sp.]
MFLKTMGALPGMIYSQESNAVYVNLFVGSRATVTLNGQSVAIRQTTRYPWEGTVAISIDPAAPTEFDIFVRIPGWSQPVDDSVGLYHDRNRRQSKPVSLAINGQPVDKFERERGYARLHRTWQAGDVIDLTLEMPVRQVVANAKVEADAGLVALMRGPIVYCAESIDNRAGIQHLVVPAEASFKDEFQPDLLGGVTLLNGLVKTRREQGAISDAPLTAIPFYVASNRAPTQMRVWLPAVIDKAIESTLATRSTPSASHCWQLDSVGAINDGVVPQKSSDNTIPRLSWWDHRGTVEWAQLDFPQETPVAKLSLFWFADRPISGGCDVPQSWQLLYRNGNDWVPVEATTEYSTKLDQFNELIFKPVTTSALRIKVKLQAGWSAGIHEVMVE